MTTPRPKAIVIGPRKFYDFFEQSRGDDWDFVGCAETVADFWEGTSIEDKNDPKYIDQDFQVVLTVDALYNPNDQKIRNQGGEDNSLETLIASLAQGDGTLVLVAQLKPAVEAQFRTAIKDACQFYSMDSDIKYWFLPKKGVKRFLDAAVSEYISVSKDRAVAGILSGEEHEPAPAYEITEETPVYDDFVDEGRLGRVIAVTSSKGGSGKSSVAVMLATYLGHSSVASVKEGLEERPLKVCLVDMDTRDSQVGFFVGALKPNVSQIVARGVSHQSIQETVISAPRLKIDCLLAPRRPRYAMEIPPTFYRDLIAALRREYDVVLLDTSVNYLDPLLEKVVYPAADILVFVTDIGRSAVLGMSRWIREVTAPVEKHGSGINPNKIGIVVNRSMKDVNMSPEQIQKACMNLPIIAFVPNNAKLVTHAQNIQSMEKVLLHDTMRQVIGQVAYSVMGNTYKLSKNLDLRSTL